MLYRLDVECAVIQRYIGDGSTVPHPEDPAPPLMVGGRDPAAGHRLASGGSSPPKPRRSVMRRPTITPHIVGRRSLFRPPVTDRYRRGAGSSVRWRPIRSMWPPSSERASTTAFPAACVPLSHAGPRIGMPWRAPFSRMPRAVPMPGPRAPTVSRSHANGSGRGTVAYEGLLDRLGQHWSRSACLCQGPRQTAGVQPDARQTTAVQQDPHRITAVQQNPHQTTAVQQNPHRITAVQQDPY